MSCHAVKLPRAASISDISGMTNNATNTPPRRDAAAGRGASREANPQRSERQSIADRVRRFSGGRDTQPAPSLNPTSDRHRQREQSRDRDRALSAQRRAAHAGSTPRNPSYREYSETQPRAVPHASSGRHAQRGGEGWTGTGTARGHGYGSISESRNGGSSHRARSEGSRALGTGDRHMGGSRSSRHPQPQPAAERADGRGQDRTATVHRHVVENMPVLSTRQQTRAVQQSSRLEAQRGSRSRSRSRSQHPVHTGRETAAHGSGVRGEAGRTIRSVRD